MSMNFRFSRGYGECPAVQQVAWCCCSNTDSADMLLQQQQATVRSTIGMAGYTGGL